MAIRARRAARKPVILVLAVVAGLVAAGCGERAPSSKLVRELTRHKEYQPPESASLDTASYLPSLYARARGDTLLGIVNPNPLEPFQDVAEAPARDLVRQLRFARQVLQERAGGSQRVSDHVNLVLDGGMNFGQVMEAIYVSSYGTFGVPHLITRSGHEHLIEPPQIHSRYGPVGWSAWVWWMPDQSIRWLAWPDSGQAFRSHRLPAREGEPNIAALVDSLRRALDGRRRIPSGPQRLIGIWAYDQLAYPKLFAVMDALRYPKEGPQVAGHLTLLQGESYAPPDSAAAE